MEEDGSMRHFMQLSYLLPQRGRALPYEGVCSVCPPLAPQDHPQSQWMLSRNMGFQEVTQSELG